MNTRSAATIDLIGLLSDREDAEVTLAIDVVNERCMPVTFTVPRDRAVRAVAAFGSHIDSAAHSLSCVTGVGRIEVRVQVDGEPVIDTGFPLLSLARIAPSLDSFLELMGAFGDVDDEFARAHFTACCR